jgi:hypothetical protein
MELKKRIGEIDLDLPVGTDHPAVGERRLMTADNDEINPRVLFTLFFAQGREIGVHHQQPNILPSEAVPSLLTQMGEPLKIVFERPLVIAVKFMISQDGKIRNISLAKCSVKVIELLPVFRRTAPGREVAEMNDKGRFPKGYFIND